jgi:cell wall assembly regulator SMI1
VDEIKCVMHDLGAAFAGGLVQPGSMQASLTTHGHQSQTYDIAGRAALIGHWDPRAGVDIYALMHQLRSATGIDGPLIIELTASPAGDYEVSFYAGDSSGSEQPALEPVVVLDADYRFPDHPRPGMARPARTLNDGRPTDPAVLAEVRTLVADFIAEHTRLLGTPPPFAAGHSEADLLAAEEKLGVRLPEDLRALYRTIHDDTAESGLLAPFNPMPLQRVVTGYHRGDPGSDAGDDRLFEHLPVVFESYPHGHVRRVSRSDWWVTFAPDYGMNYAAVDLDPAEAGEFGQILMYGRDVHGPVVHVAPSVRHLMRTAVASIREAASGEEWELWEPPVPPVHRWSVNLGEADLAGLATIVAEPSMIQLVYLSAAGRVRLTELAGLPQLRAILVGDLAQRPTHIDLSIPAGLPVEQIDITAEHFDPAQLAGTPTLSYVSLGGNTAPVQIAALAALPDLVRLDLAGAAVTDVTAVATFPGLRVLTLDASLWRELLGTGWQPDGLAAARLGGRGGVAEAAAWHGALTHTDLSAARHGTVRGPHRPSKEPGRAASCSSSSPT